MITIIVFLIAMALIALAVWRTVAAYQAGTEEDNYGRRQPIEGAEPKAPMGLWALAAAGIVALVLSLGFTEIHPGYVGVVTNLGVVQDDELPPGIHYVIPILNSITEFDTRVRAVRLENYTAASREQQDLFLTITLNYHVIPDEASVIVQTVGSDFQEKIVMPRLLDIPKSVTDDFGTATVLNSRDEIRVQAEDLLSEALAPFGLVVDSINLENFGYSPEYNAAIEARAVAEQQVQTERQKLEQQRVQAESAVVTAEGKANARIEEARGESEANRLLNESLTGDLIQWEAIQKLNPNVQVMLVPTGEGFILDVGGLQPEASAAP